MRHLAPILLTLTFSLTLFTPAHPSTPVHCQKTILGSLSGPYDGDFLSDNSCKCKKLLPDYEYSVVGTIIQWQYYNFHRNLTFFMCTNKGGSWCHTIRREPSEDHPEKKDEFCFRRNYLTGNEFVSFNGQERELGPGGGQGYNVRSADAFCMDVYMQTHGNDTVGIGDEYYYDDVDDMCPGCK